MNTLKPILIREKVINAVREFFSTRSFHEVIIPIFNTSLPLEPNIYAFRLGKYYLPTSPEATLKKKIAQGMGNCFAIGHTFRDLEGSSAIHKPEFLMLEWYREDATYEDIMSECEELIRSFRTKRKWSEKSSADASLDFSPAARNDKKTSWPRISMVELFQKYAKLHLEEMIDDKTILKVAKERKYNIKGATWEQIFNQIFLNEVEPHLPKKPFFLTDYPAKISPLCAKRADKPHLAERFELYIGGVEIANGNSENTDAEGILRSMKEEEKYRKKRGILSPPIDMEFIEALRKMHGKNYAGSGLGVERLAMVLGGIDDIGELQ